MKKLIFFLVLTVWLMSSTSAFAAPGQAISGGYQVVDTITVGNYPLGIAFNPRNGYLYVANASDDTVSVIDGAANTVIATIPVGSSPRGVAYDPRTGDMYVSETQCSHVC